MNRTKLKNYAPQARRDFIQAVTDRAAHYGLTAKKIEPITEKGDVVLIAGQPYSRAVGEKRKKLEGRITTIGFEQTIEAVAFTWFNRLVALRFMELHGYLDHGYRVLSHSESHGQPELLEHAEHVELAGLDKQKVIALKLDGTKEEELYRHVLLAQCNALNNAMPFLFERIDDETVLLLPDNLLHSDSLIRKLVSEIDEEDWQEVEIIGWLYQFYISEKKDEVIGKVVASEDIPAATQLFTPNWIVKYLVQNTLGRQWLATYPQSALRQQMQYYIEPADQTPEVQEQLKAITPTSLNPEELTLLDPACGSGHILVEAYDLFKAIYLERGFRAKDIPAMILQKNLFGLEIDDRAAQLAAFALMMKARADDRRIFDGDAKPNVLSLQDSKGLNPADITFALNAPINKDDIPKEYLFAEIQDEKDGLFSKRMLSEKGHISQGDIVSLLELFEKAKTFGSLIQVPPKLATKLPEIEQRLNEVLKHGDLTHASAHVIEPLLQQARLLATQYDAVVANPPYMGSKSFEPVLKKFLDLHFPWGKKDLYAAFILRGQQFTATGGVFGLITIPNWIFLSSFDDLRLHLCKTVHFLTLVNNGRGIWGSDFGSAMFVASNMPLSLYNGAYRRLFTKSGSVSDVDELRERFLTSANHIASSDDFQKMPGCRIAFWISKYARTLFASCKTIGDYNEPQVGLQTSYNDRFIRRWPEVEFSRIGFACKTNVDAATGGCKWFPLDKGGEFRRWYGNNETVVNWEFDGKEIKQYVAERYPYLKGNTDYVVKDRGYFFRPGVTWNKISIALLSARASFTGSIFTDAGMKLLCDTETELYGFLGFLNSSVCAYLLEVFSATVNFEKGAIESLPFVGADSISSKSIKDAIHISKMDWDAVETSWDFQVSSLLLERQTDTTVSKAWTGYANLTEARRARMKECEEENNKLFIQAYGLQSELSPDVGDEYITLCIPSMDSEIKRLISYVIGCIMGRYSLDQPGIVYAHSGNQGFTPSQYKTFPADDDGILPLFDTDWGIRDDATNRFVEFIGVAWPKEHLEENLKFVADSLSPTNGEQPRDTIRRYLATGFYKHHVSMYKKRPIYWLFSSGKQRAFQCLVYLHRYHEGTLSRMRTEYVIPLLGKLTARIAQLADDILAATSSQQRKRLEKARDTASRQLVELQGFDEKLRHYADQRITLDLDDGVKVNYGKFGDLLAEVKAVCGKDGDEG